MYMATRQINLTDIRDCCPIQEIEEGFERDIKIERKFASDIKVILGEYFITQDPVMDREKGTDFLTFTVQSFKVGVRLRRYYFFIAGERSWYNHRGEKYIAYPKEEFTIRWERPSGNKTEIHKIREGLVQYFLYGFLNENETKIIQYFIGNLAIFRNNEPEPIDIKANKKRDSVLAIYKRNEMPINFEVAFFLDDDYK